MTTMPHVVRLSIFLLITNAAFAAQRAVVPAPQAPPDWQIAGTVISALDGRPVSGAQVRIVSNNNPTSADAALTGSDGRFVFHGLTPGKYVLQARHYGFVRQGYQQHGSYFTGIAVGPGLPAPDLLFRLQPAAVISGKVFDQAGDPVREASVMLLHKALVNGQWATRLSDSVTTDDQGSFHFGQLLPGSYFVLVTAQPWFARFAMRSGMATVGNLTATVADSSFDVAYPITYYQDAADLSDATPIELQAGEHSTADITLTPVPAQHITVRTADSNPASGFTASLTQHVADGSTIPVQTMFQQVAPGVFESEGVPPGSYEMDGRFYGPNSGRQGREQIRTVEAGKGHEVDLGESSDAASVSGSVRFIPAVKPPAHLFIVLSPRNAQNVLSAEITPRSDFVFDRPVPPGEYEAGSSFAGEFFVVSVGATGATVKGRMLQIAGSDPVTLQVVMSRGVAQVKGTAVRDGKPISGALVVLVPRDPANNQPLFRADQSDSDGTFTLPSIVPGKYTLVAVDNGWGLEWRNPAALKPYLSRGQVLQIAPEGRYNIRPEVQDF
ncbi:MAG TPA: carboxypeptidase regulatory-like domain-containing protein [Terriglobales bacterium]|nr:carboxypeptidase regulatory-like domain-containing protein [Terriglobales bacterium]